MTFLYREALISIALAVARVVQQRTGYTICALSLGLVGAGGVLWPVTDGSPDARRWLVAALVAVWSLRLGLPIAVQRAGAPRNGAMR